MKDNFIRFLYAVDVYLLYLLSGVVSAAGVVAYYSIRAALDYGSIGEIADASAFVEHISALVTGKSPLVLLISYIVVVFVLFLCFALRRKSVFAYVGLSYGRFVSVISAMFLGVVLNLITYSLVPETAQEASEINTVLVLCVILGPVIEELMFRGVLLKMFGAACGTVAASVITAALFALTHTESVQMIYTFVLGVILAAIRVRSTSLWPPILLHLSFNITGAVMMINPCMFTPKGILALFGVSVLLFVLSCTGGRRYVKKRSSKMKKLIFFEFFEKNTKKHLQNLPECDKIFRS